jgi:hypothetical protein
MTVVTCPIKGTYLVRDEAQPIPLGKTPTDVSVVVQEYEFGWVCGSCGYSGDTTRAACDHIKAAQDAARS